MSARFDVYRYRAPQGDSPAVIAWLRKRVAFHTGRDIARWEWQTSEQYAAALRAALAQVK